MNPLINAKPINLHIEDSSQNNLFDGEIDSGARQDNNLNATASPIISSCGFTSKAPESLNDQNISVQHSHGHNIKSLEIEKILVEGDFKSYKDPVKLMLGKIVRCKRGVYLKAKCPHCKKIVSDEHGEMSVRKTCDNRFCNDPFCIISRKMKAMQRLESYNVQARDLIHAEISFPLQVGETKDKKQRRDLTMRNISQSFKRLGINLHALMVWDIKVKQRGDLEFYFMHFHLAILPMNYQKFFRAQSIVRRDVIKRTGQEFIIHVEGWRPKESLFTYFSQIMAGEISIGEEHHTAHYRDFISPEQYHKLFYRKNMLRMWSMKKWAVSVCAVEPGRDSMFKHIGLSLPNNCPNCFGELTKETIIIIKVLEEQKPPNLTKDFLDYGVISYERISKNSINQDPEINLSEATSDFIQEFK